MTIVTLDAVRTANPAWFAPGAMRWFGTRLARKGFRDANGAVYFVTSEEDRYADDPMPRLYTVRVYKGEGYGIDTVGDFCGWETSRAATREAMRLASS